MSIALLVAVGGLVTCGMYLITSRSLSRIVIGFAILGHAAVVGLLAAGGPAGETPIVGSEADSLSDPLPQALSLTAIVIGFALTLFLLALARRQSELEGDDLVEDDVEDRRVSDEHGFDDDALAEVEAEEVGE